MDLPKNSPLTAEQEKLLNQLWGEADLNQKAFLSAWVGHLGTTLEDASSGPKVPLTIIFGTEGGNCEALANGTVKLAKKAGFTPKVVDFADIQPADLAGYENVLIYVSTWGEGDAPERVEPFDKAFAVDSPDLSGVKYSICGLGDTSYVDFCEIAKKYDARIEELGGTRVLDRVDLDVDFEDGAAAWTGNALKTFGELLGVEANDNAIPVYDFSGGKNYSPKEPFIGELTEKIMLNGTGTEKETWHFEINLEGSGMKYQVGDALGVVPENDEDMMAEINAITGANADLSGLDINALTKPVIEKYVAVTGDKGAEKFLDDTYGYEIIDMLKAFPHDLTAEQLIGCLRKLPPRLYSISSSMADVGDQVDLTIASVRYNSHGRDRKGVASCYLADAAEKGSKVKVYLKPNKNFRLPEDTNAPVIMVGPGTGVAPFRAFMQEREATGANGDNWLFFGDQKYNFDFLYQLEWQGWSDAGLLTNLDVAFSRDKPQKVYVQHRMEEKAAELKAWLEKGAYFYVCGDESRMAKDVDATLRKIVGDEFVDEMKKNGRYQRDVY